MPTERRLVTRRLGLAVLASVLALFALGVIGSHVFEGMVRWLHNRPTYQTTFDAIALEPPPPGWYRGGRMAFLERVRQAAQREDRPFSALDLGLDELGREFRLYCWVKRVSRVERSAPNRLLVRLEYRNPVALAPLPGKDECVLLDEEAVILPLADVELEKIAPLIRISSRDLNLPLELRYGQQWKTGEKSAGLGKADERVLAAAKLAAFLKSATALEGRSISPVLQPSTIHPVRKDGLFIQNVEKTLIFWAEPPGDERPGRPTALEKWAMLHRWLPQRPETPVTYPPYYLIFSKEGVVIWEEKRN